MQPVRPDSQVPSPAAPAPGERKKLCLICGKELPATGICDTCDGQPSFLNSVLLLLGPAALTTVFWLAGMLGAFGSPTGKDNLFVNTFAWLVGLTSLICTVIVARRIARRILKMRSAQSPTLGSVLLTLLFIFLITSVLFAMQMLLMLALLFGACFCGKNGSHL